MKAIQVTFEDATLAEMRRVLKGKRRARSEFIREAVRRELSRLRELELDEQERKGYERIPDDPREFEWLRRRQVWPKW